MVSNNKLKILMNAEDLKEYSLDTSVTSYDDPQLRRTFWRLLDLARERCGFSAAGERVLIHFYPSGDGGELFVTKLGKLSSDAERSVSTSRSVALLVSRHAIYRFPDSASLIELARRLPEGIREKSARLYYCDDECYYLVLEERGGGNTLSELSFFGEFAREVSHTLEPYVIEHACLISDGDVLLQLAQL